MRKAFLLICLLIPLCVLAASTDTLSVRQSRKSLLVGKYLSVLEDPSGAFTINDIFHKSDQFRAVETDVPLFASRETYIWTKLVLKNETGNNLWLELRNPTTDTILFYQQSNQILLSKQSGDKVPFYKRDILSNRILFNISYSPEPVTLYLRLNIRLPRQFPVYIISSDAFYESGNMDFFIDGLFYGLMTVIAVYNLFLWLMIRDKSYLYYIGYIVFTGLLLMHFDGITYAYLWPGYPAINDHPAVLASLPMFFAVLFVSAFLNLRQNYPVLVKGLHIFVFLWIVCCLISLSGYKFLALSVSQATAFAAAFYFFTIGVLVYRWGYVPARYYLAGWTILILGVLIFLSKDMGWLPYNPLTFNSLKIGTAAEAVFMAFALADRVNFYRTEKNRLESEKELETSGRIKAEDELKNAEELLMDYTQNLKQQNSLIERFKDDLQKLEFKIKGRELQKDQTEQIDLLLKSIILTEDDWISFRKLFDQVYEGYIFRVKSRYHGLTETDIRLITLMKLKLNQREMSNMLGVTTEAVRKSKQRLRKKLGLTGEGMEEELSEI